MPTIVRHELPNGVRVRTVEHHAVPVVTFIVQIEGGSGVDPGSREGLAAVVADMADEGTGPLGALDVAEGLARIGAHYEVDVGPDATTIELTAPARFAGRGAGLLSDLVIRPSLRERDFERVRQLRLDRLGQLKDMPPAVAERTMLRLLYGTHPYGHLSIGNSAALRELTLQDVLRFHASVARPVRTTVVACGAFDHQRLAGLVGRAFGSWEASSSEPAVGPPASTVAVAQTAVTPLALVAREAAQQSELRIGHVSVGRNTPDYPALLVMNAVLGGQFVSRVNLKLREEKGYTYGARTGFDWRRGPTPFTLHASVHTAVTADAIRDSLRELTDIRAARPVSEEELALAKASLTRGYPRNFETADQVAHAVTQLALYDLPDTYFEEFGPRVDAVTSAAVTDVAQRHLDPSRMTTLVVGDRAAIEASLRNLDLGEPRVIAVDE